MKTAIITGAHEYDVVNFHRMFRELHGLDCYVQSLEDFATDPDGGWKRYDAVVFFNYHRQTPGSVGDELDSAIGDTLGGLISSGTGIVLLHHAILCYPDWPVWRDLSGIRDRTPAGSAVDQRLRIEPAEGDHPITRGVDAWEMTDETYEDVEVGDGSHVLLTTDHPGSMETIGWTRNRANARTFCFQSGHDNQTWTNPTFRLILERGVQWASGRL